jgi:ABC-type glycerol-3-phosphate transport system substrate-binding protein
MNRLTKKVALVFLIQCLVVGSFVFAGGSNQSAASSGPRTGKGVTIRILTRWSGASVVTPLFDKAKKEFQAKYPDITIQDESRYDSNAFTNQFRTDIASGNVADIILWPGISILKDYAENGVFLNVEDLINTTPAYKDKMDPAMIKMLDLSSIGVKGIYAVPLYYTMEVFYYNKDLFTRAGITKVPETWDDFYEACDKLLKIGVVPWTVGATTKWRIVHAHTGMVYKMSGVQKAIDLGSRKAKWTDPDMVAVFAKIRDMVTRGYIARDAAGINYDTERARFQSGETAMIFAQSNFAPELKGEALARTGTFRMPSFSDKPQFKDQDIAYLTQLELGGHLKSQPDKLQYVWELVSLLATKPYQEMYLYDCGSIPLSSEVTVDPSRLNPRLAEMLNFRKEIQVWGRDSWA